MSRIDPPARQPLFNRFPAVLVWLAAAIAGVTALQLFGPPQAEDWLLRAGAIVTGAQPPRPLGDAAPYVLHVFLHGGVVHLLVNLGALIAFGPPVAESFGRGFRGAAAFLVFFFACAAGGAAGQVIAAGGEPGIAVGASSALSGVLAAAGYAQGGWAGAARMAAPWLLINIVLAATAAAFPIPIAWAAHVGGLVTGFMLFPLFLTAFGGRRKARRSVTRSPFE